MQKLGWFGGDGGLYASPRVIGNIAICYSAYMTSYSTLTETMHLSHTVFEL